MALIKCRECGREISSKSATCPGCGAPVKGKRNPATGCLVLLGIFFVVGLLGHLHNSATSTSSTAGSSPAALAVASPTANYTPYVPPPSATPDLSLLQITKKTWEKGGLDSVALWHITFWNRSEKPIGNIRYRTRYSAETGDQVDKGGVDALLGDYTIRKVIPPHQKRTIEINDGFLHHEAARANFEIVSFEFVNPP